MNASLKEATQTETTLTGSCVKRGRIKNESHDLLLSIATAKSCQKDRASPRRYLRLLKRHYRSTRVLCFPKVSLPPARHFLARSAQDAELLPQWRICESAQADIVKSARNNAARLRPRAA